MTELYEQIPILDEQLQFALFSYQPTSFNEVVKDAQWVKSMNEEIDAIEKTKLGILLTSLQTKLVLESNGSIIPN